MGGGGDSKFWAYPFERPAAWRRNRARWLGGVVAGFVGLAIFTSNRTVYFQPTPNTGARSWKAEGQFWLTGGRTPPPAKTTSLPVDE